MEDVSSGAFSPGIFYRDQEPAEYASFPLVNVPGSEPCYI